MKSALASFAAVVVLVAGAPAANLNQTTFPRWVCELFPMFCPNR